MWNIFEVEENILYNEVFEDLWKHRIKCKCNLINPLKYDWYIDDVSISEEIIARLAYECMACTYETKLNEDRYLDGVDYNFSKQLAYLLVNDDIQFVRNIVWT